MNEKIKTKADGIKFIINLAEKIAEIDSNQDKIKGKVIISKIINYSNIESKVTSIPNEAFKSSHIKSTIFDIDSQITIIPARSFISSQLETITLSRRIIQQLNNQHLNIAINLRR